MLCLKGLKVAFLLKDFYTKRPTDSMAKLWKRKKGIVKGTSEIQEITYVHRFTGHVSVHFLHTFI